MTVPVQSPSVEYTENGTSVDYPVPFRYRDPAHLRAQRTSSDGSITELVNGVDFTAGAGDSEAGGTLTVTAAGAASTKLAIWRETPLEQKSDYIATGKFTAESHENALDEVVLMQQDQKADSDRAPKVPRGEAAFEFASFANAQEGDIVEIVSGKAQPSSQASSFVGQLLVDAQSAASDAANSAQLAALGTDIAFAANFNAGERAASDGDLFYVPDSGQWKIYKKGESADREDIHLLLGNAVAQAAAPVLSPGFAWDGTAGSGYAVPPADPTRTTAKPAVRLLVPDHQYFTDELEVGVAAYANNSGSLLDNCGLSHVVFHFEGGTAQVAAPSYRTFTRKDGSTYEVLGWWVRLRKPIGTQGEGDMYIEAVPSDPAMQSRIIGPHSFSPHDIFKTTGTIHDYELVVDPDADEVAGVSYQTLVDAYTYLQIEQSDNPRITLLKPALSDFHNLTRGHFAQWGGKGYCTIEAAVPVKIGKAAFVTLASAEARPFYTALHFKGDNIVIEFQNMEAIYGDDANTKRNMWFDGVTIQNSGTRENHWQKGPRPTGLFRNQSAWITDCDISGLPIVFNVASLARGNIVTGGFFDCANHAQCLVGNIIRDWDSQFWTNDRDAMSVQYTGAGASATLEMTGGNDANTRTLTARVDGAPIDTFIVSKGDDAVSDDTNWKVSDVVGWLNGLTDWTATTLDDSLRAVMLGSPGRDGAFDVTDVKTAAATFVTQNGKHADFWQLLETNPPSAVENIIVADNKVTEFAGQKLFLSATSTTLHDAIFINNVFGDRKPGGQYEKAVNLFSQFARSAHSHVVIAHNSIEQGVILRPDNGYDPGPYCMVSNNVAGGIVWQGTPDGDLVIDSNHLFAGASDPAGATGTTIGGTVSTNFFDLSSGDARPAGELAAALKTPALARDRIADRRAVTAPAGAIA